MSADAPSPRPVEEARFELAAWIPWATTACLAALAACLIELWMIERARNQLLRDQGELAQSALQAMGNQLEAERIISRREMEGRRPSPAAAGALVVALLAPGQDGVPGMGAVAWDPADGRGVVRVSGLPPQALERDYQLWIEGAPAARCAVFHAQSGECDAQVRLDPSLASRPGARFLLVEGPRGGSGSLGEARAGGSIVLATPLPGGRISNP
jgi:hypothetical protein